MFGMFSSLWKKKCFAIGLTTQFLSCKDTYNSLYLYIVNANRQVAKLQLTIYMVQLIAIKSKQFIFNYYATSLYYTHHVILTSLIVIHTLKSNTWHYEDIWTIFLYKTIDLHHPLWLLLMVQDYDMWHNKTNYHMAY